MRVLINFIILLIPFVLSGCDQDEALSPPSNGKNISLTVKLPKEMKLLPLGVMYRSTTCHKSDVDRYGNEVKKPGYHFLNETFQQEDKSNHYSISVALNGGGGCNWQLSNVTIEIEYRLDSFGKNIDDAVGSGIIIIFDDNLPQQYEGKVQDISGDFAIKKDYYPWINEVFLNGYSRKIWLYSDRLYTTYKSKNANKISFEPISHSELITYSVGPKSKSDNLNNYVQYTYPDGTVDFYGASMPDLRKLQVLSKHNDVIQ